MSAALGYLHDWQVGWYITDLLSKDSFCALHTSDPGVAGDQPGNTEATTSGSAYVRARVLWARSGARVVVSRNAQTWHGMPETLVTHLAIWNAVAGGNVRAVIPLLSPMYISGPGQFGLKVGDLYLRWP